MLNGYTQELARRLASCIIGAVMTCSAAADPAGLILPQSADDTVALAVPDGFADDPSDILQIFVGQAEACCDTRTPIAGTYTQKNAELRFAPVFGFVASQDYVAQVSSGSGQTLIRFRLPSEDAVIPATVTEIYPSGDVLPENILRFYIHFSAPMKPGVAFDYIKLRDAAGNADEAAFMRFKQELWSQDRTRLTVLIDPGRIKRGVATNLEHGPALLAGHAYTLSVDAGWSSADGATTLPAFSKAFTVTAPLRERPHVKQWRVSAPCTGTRDPLQIAFDRSFDRHLLSRTIQVILGDGQVMAGAVDVTDAERSWSFLPERAWPAEDVRIRVDAGLEDVAGNNFRDLLDHLGHDEVSDVSTLMISVSRSQCAW